MEKEEYEGWSNRETWAVALHLNNTQWMYADYRTLLADVKDRKNNVAEWTDEEFLKFTYETEFKEYVEHLFEVFFNPEETDTSDRYDQQMTDDIRLMVSDVGSLWRVNWKELALSLMEE